MARSTHDDFIIEGRLGNGSYGCVWRVTRKIDGLAYAMKEIDLLGLSRKEQEDCIKETRVLSSLTSDHCIKYYDSFLERNKLFIVMEYAGGGNLHDYIKRSPTRLPEDVVWRIFIEMLLGLNHMHRKKILHRDVKTLNIFLTSTDPARMHIKLGDMGVAKILSTQTNFAKTIVGTPYYLSPELCEDKPYNDKSDVWALGVVLYECCTKRHPFDADNQGALILKILRGKYPPVTGYTAELIEVVRMCLTLNAAKRPDTNQLLYLPIVRQRALEQGISLPDIPPPRSSGTRPGTSASRPGTSAVGSTTTRSGVSPLRQGAAPRSSRSAAGPSPGAVAAVTAAAVAVTAAAPAVAAPGARPRTRASPPPAARRSPAVSPRDAGGNIVVTGNMNGAPEFNPISPEDIAFKFGSTMPSGQGVEARARQMAANNAAVQAPAHHRHRSGGSPANNAQEVMPDGVHVGGHNAAGMARAWEDVPSAELEGLHLDGDDGHRRQSKEDFLVDDDYNGEDGSMQEDDNIPALIDVEAIKKSLLMLRTAAMGMIGADTFERLYDMIRTHSDHENNPSSETTITELSAMVFNIINVNQADVIPLVYKIMFLEAQIERAIVQGS